MLWARPRGLGWQAGEANEQTRLSFDKHVSLFELHTHLIWRSGSTTLEGGRRGGREGGTDGRWVGVVCWYIYTVHGLLGARSGGEPEMEGGKSRRGESERDRERERVREVIFGRLGFEISGFASFWGTVLSVYESQIASELELMSWCFLVSSLWPGVERWLCVRDPLLLVVASEHKGCTHG